MQVGGSSAGPAQATEDGGEEVWSNTQVALFLNLGFQAGRRESGNLRAAPTQ